MKICRKCENEYKDVYLFCPKCGTPFDPKMKYAKIPGHVSHETLDILIKIFNILLYVFGLFIIFIYLINFKINIKDSIFAIIFGLSLFKIFYDLLRENLKKVNRIIILAIRIVIPTIILIIWMNC